MEALGVPPSDSFMLLVVGLQYHLRLYQDMPDKISAAAEETLRQYKEAANAEIMVINKRAIDKARVKMIAICVLLSSLVFALFGVTAFYYGSRSGQALGYAAARQESVAAAWGATAPGQVAQELHKLGTLDRVADCAQPGWVIKDDVCFPYEDKDGSVYGWKILPRK